MKPLVDLAGSASRPQTPSGRPTLELTGGAKVQLDRITPAGHKAQILLTITDDYPYAQAIVMIEAVPHP